MVFNTESNGHKITMDGYSRDVGGEDNRPPPKPMMIVALGDCNGQFVVPLLKNMRVDVVDFKIIVEAEETEKYPKHYSKTHQIYIFTIKDLNKKIIEKAVDLSENKYCGVTYTSTCGHTTKSNYPSQVNAPVSYGNNIESA
ncbi:MAG: OsmC family protein [Bacteroidota bacterium]|nr:OsmC family protein [Bacteroidota bacterium]